MKRFLYFAMLLPLMIACVGNGTTDENGSSDSDSVAPLCDAAVSVQGIVGEGTTMHELELLLPDDSIAYFSYDNDALGGLAAGDEVVVSWMKSNECQVYISNITSLSHLWQIVNAEGRQCLQLDKNGGATTYGMDSTYDHWESSFGLLRLYNNNVVSQWNIQLLTSDSLIIDDGGDVAWTMKRIN